MTSVLKYIGKVMVNYFSHQIILLNHEAADRNSALRELSDALLREKIVSEGFYDALVKREDEYPTAIAIKDADFAVAIPHASSEFVCENQIGLMTLKEPVIFETMAARKKTEVRMIFMLALKDEKQTAMLAELMKLFSDRKKLAELFDCNSSSEVIEILKGNSNEIIG